MKARTIRRMGLVLAAGTFVLWAWKAPAQDVPIATPSPQLPYAAAQVVKLEQAKVGESTIVSYINSSGNSYSLDASQIIYLKQQGVSDAALNAMLTQPKPGAPAETAEVQQAPPSSIIAPESDADSSIIPPTTSPPAVVYVPNTPPVSYSYPYYYPNYGYSYYGPAYYFPRVSFGWNWYGGGWHWGGGWHGTTVWHGGTWHAGGTWHSGGWSGGAHGGGSWHSGGGGHGGHH